MFIDLIETFKKAVETIHSLRESPFVNLGSHILGYAATLGLGLWLSSRKIKKAKEAALKALTAHEVLGSEAIVTETYFEPTGEINPDTGREFKNMKIRAVDAKLPLSEIFNNRYATQVLAYFEEALPHCTLEAPDVFQHLPKVIPPKIAEEGIKRIASNWKAHFGALYKGKVGAHVGLLAKDERYEEKQALALLVYEKGTTAKQFRIVVVHEDQFQLNDLPQPEDLRFETGKTFVHDLNHGQAERIRLHTSIANGFNNGAREIYDQFLFSYPTGNVIKVAPKKGKALILPSTYDREWARYARASVATLT